MRSTYRFVLRSAIAVTIVYSATLIALVNLENRLVYPGAYMPATDLQGISSSDGMINEVQYRTCDGLLLRGRLLETSLSSDISAEPPTNRQSDPTIPQAKETVLVLHGNANRAVYLEERMRRLAYYLNANVMAAEYRGFEDDHTPSEEGLKQDCIAAMDFLCDRYSLTPNDITIFGTSLGGGCATTLAAQRGAKVVILDRTFDQLVEVAAEKYPIFPIRSIMKNRFDSVSNLQVYRGPLIMIHGDQDEIVSIERGRYLFEQASCSPKYWIEVPGFSHMMTLPDDTLGQIQTRFHEIVADIAKKKPSPDQPTPATDSAPTNSAPTNSAAPNAAATAPFPKIDRTIGSTIQRLDAPEGTQAIHVININTDTQPAAPDKSEGR